MNSLIDRARAALEASRLATDLDRTMGVFVTLRDEDGVVLGSVGTTEPDRSLASLLPEMVREAALADPRHPPVAPGDAHSMEIWLLPEPPRSVRDPAQLDPCGDVLRIRSGILAGALLPDVAAANGWNAETALAYACRKAGLSAGAWRDPDTDVRAYRAVLVRV